jgi:vacuolar-type H+-ATPase subunit I/STV1
VVPEIARPALVLGLGLTFLAKGHVWQVASAAEATSRDRTLGLAMLGVLVGLMLALAFGSPGSVLWALTGLLVIVFVLSAGARKAFVATLAGAYEVYGLSGFIGDVLSYTRLAALGLSGLLVGMVFNILGGMVWGGAIGMMSGGGFGILLGVVVALLAVTVLVVGHVFNVVINLLGAFVHPARLQFVEFFSKFYEGGGKSYQPFSYESKTLVLEPDGSRKEGGTS